MISFRKFLNERALVDARVAQGLTFANGYFIPLSPTMFKRLNIYDNARAFHMLGIDGLEHLKRMQGTKRTISCFTRIGERTLKTPIDAGNKGASGLVVELEGKRVAHGAEDIFTKPDQQGRRWVTVADLIGVKGERRTFRDKVISEIKDLYVDILGREEFKEINSKYNHWNDIPKILTNMGDKKKSGKIKAKLIAAYYEGIQKIIGKYREDFIKYALTPEATENRSIIDYDEIVLSEIVIKKIYIYQYKHPEVSGLQAIKKFREKWKPIPIINVNGEGRMAEIAKV